MKKIIKSFMKAIDGLLSFGGVLIITIIGLLGFIVGIPIVFVVSGLMGSISFWKKVFINFNKNNK